ncbi:hypothetical protein EV146_10566 [Mesobacillus foraminis]|uniref:Uncharacterized protein n=1 Tax=Mesobacillus foraminis TaxID=279826 RepID=A0A4V6NKR2_9BACI|nr:hypothetical protein EV146_10566 [Mesobacillus foraminis]
MIVLIKMQLLSMAILLGGTLRYRHYKVPSASGTHFSLCVTSTTSSLLLRSRIFSLRHLHHCFTSFRSRIFSLRYLHHCFTSAQVTHFLLALPPPLLPFCSGHAFSLCVTSTTSSLLLRLRIFSLRHLHHCFTSAQVTHFLLALPPPLLPFFQVTHFLLALPPPLLPFCTGHAFSPCVTSTTASLLYRSRIFSLRYHDL